MFEKMKCLEIMAWELRDMGVSLNGLNVERNTVIVQAKTVNPTAVFLIGLIFCDGSYTPLNLLGQIKFLEQEDGAKVGRTTKTLLRRAQFGFLSDIRSPFFGKEQMIKLTPHLIANK